MNLTRENTAIVLDSTADFPEAAERFSNWRVVPLYVNFGTESFRDGVDLSAAEFYERLTSSDVMPTTSQPTPGDFGAAYQALDSYERIYSLQISARLSGTFESATSAADERVRVIDTETASAAITMLGLAIQRRLDRGTTDEEIGKLIVGYLHAHRLLFTVETLEFLQRGGRIGRAQAFAGELLHVKPILSIRDGEAVPVKRVRGERKAFQEFVDALLADTHDDPSVRVGIAHAAAPERAAQLARTVRELRPRAEIEVETMLGAVIGAHAGPGTVGFFWFRDEDQSSAP
ncbi:MAG TPA: DegV family protein [Gaiellaceae bacterium]|nr:DegV family protein [Gaiellaceae bacterium]